MAHDPALLEQLSGFPTVAFDGEVFRATRQRLNALTPSTSGGRWVPPGTTPVLYTSLTREGALAEISFHWGRLTPLPTKPAAIHRIHVAARKTLRLIETDLSRLGIDPDAYRQINDPRTQAIGAAVAFLGCDGLLAPSARWSCDNLMLFAENRAVTDRLEVIESKEINWLNWAVAHRLIDLPE